MTKFLNISTDNTLGGNSPSDETVSSQKAIKDYVDANAGGNAMWGNITGTLSNQTDLQTALNAKANDSYVVKLTGNQTIDNIKTFKNNIKRSMGELDITTAPSSNQFIDWISPQDKNGVSVGYFGTVHRTNSELGSRLGVSRQINGTWRYQDISINIASDGTLRTYAPTPSEDTTNSTQIDTVGARNTKLNSLLDALYPVGAIYITTASTCPLSTLISGSTWTLVSSGIVKSGDIPCKGTGKTLGITNGSNNYGFTSGSAYFSARTDAYYVDVNSSSQASASVTGRIGITTDSTKSGIIADTSSLTLSVNIFERTA